MGQWSPTFFGSDAALDVWDAMSSELKLCEDGREFFPTPGDWDAGLVAIIRGKATEIESWAQDRLRLERDAHVREYLISLVILGAAAGVDIPSAHLTETIALLETAVRDLGIRIESIPTSSGFGKASFIKRHICLDVLESLKREARPENPCIFLQYCGVITSGKLIDRSVRESLQRDIPGLPDFYGNEARAALDKALARPEIRDSIATRLHLPIDGAPWGETAVLSVILAAIALMSAGAPVSDGFRAIAREAGTHDDNHSAGRAKIRAAFQSALDIYREDENMIFGEETLAQAFGRHKGGGLINI